MNLDIMAIIEQYALIPVAAVCWMLGWLLKHVWEGFPNRFIPVVLLPIAIVGVLWINGWAVTPENILAGICSAAVAVYAHQTVKQITETDPPDADESAAGGGLNG